MKEPKLRAFAFYLLLLLVFLCQCNTKNDGFTGVIHSGTTKNPSKSSAVGTYKVRTIFNNEIPSHIRKKIYSNHLLFMAALQKKNKGIIKKVISSKFKDNAIDELFDLIENHEPFEDLILLNEYYSIVESNGDVSYPIIPDRKSLFIINSVNVKNSEIYNVFQVSQGHIYQQLYHTMYVLEDAFWKVGAFYTGLYAVDNKNAIEWHKIAKLSFLNANPFEAYFSSAISNKLQRTIPYLQFRDEKEIIKNNNEIMQASLQLLKNSRFFNMSEKDEIIGFDFEISKYGCCPIIKYIRNRKIKNRNECEKDASNISSELNKKYPKIKNIFKILCFQAFDKKLVGGKKNKPLHSTVVELESNNIIKF